MLCTRQTTSSRCPGALGSHVHSADPLYWHHLLLQMPPPHTPESESAFSPDHLHPQLLRCLLKFEKHWCCSFHPSSLPWSTREHCTFVSNNTWEKVCGTDAALILSFAEYKYPLLIPPPPQKLTYMYCQFYNVYNLVHLAFIKLIVLALIFFLCLKIICSLTIPSVLVLMLGRKNSDL